MTSTYLVYTNNGPWDANTFGVIGTSDKGLRAQSILKLVNQSQHNRYRDEDLINIKAADVPQVMKVNNFKLHTPNGMIVGAINVGSFSDGYTLSPGSSLYIVVEYGDHTVDGYRTVRITQSVTYSAISSTDDDILQDAMKLYDEGMKFGVPVFEIIE